MSKKSQEKYRAAGLCILCGKNDPKPDRQSCEACLLRGRLKIKRRRDGRIASGQCGRCGIGELVNKRFCFTCYEDHKESAKKNYLILKDKVFDYYGGYVCACCGETEKVFLTIDHINGGGCKHRRAIGQSNVYRWLRDNGYPNGYRVLCMNCQWGTKNGKICPHKRKKCHQS